MFPRDGYVQGIKALKAIGGNFDFDFSAHKISVEAERPDVAMGFTPAVQISERK